MKNIMRKPLILVVLMIGLLMFTACGGSSSGSSNAPTADEIKGLIDDDINIVEEQLDQEIKAESDGVSGADAATLANNCYALINRLSVISGSLDNDVKDGYITEVEKSDYDVKIAELEGKIGEEAESLKTKAGADASSIDPSTKLITVISKEGLDYLISDNEQLLDNLERGVGDASSETKATFENLISNRLVTIKTALDDLGDLESKGIITSDEKGTYETDIKDLADRFSSLEEQIAR